MDVLNYALTLEYLEDEFYKAGNAAANMTQGGVNIKGLASKSDAAITGPFIKK